jgi:hypothetical protein
VTALLAALALLGPVVVHDAGERTPLGSVGARPGAVAAARVVYRRVTGRWVQWWLLYARNDQDRGILRTGRHAGDWEMVQVRVDAAGARSRPSTPSTPAPSGAGGRRSSNAAGGR